MDFLRTLPRSYLIGIPLGLIAIVLIAWLVQR